MAFQDVVRNDSALFVMVVVGILDMVDTEVVETCDADDIKEKSAAGLSEEGNLDRIEAEADGFTST